MLNPDEKRSSLVFLLAFCLSAMLSALLLCMLPVTDYLLMVPYSSQHQPTLLDLFTALIAPQYIDYWYLITVYAQGNSNKCCVRTLACMSYHACTLHVVFTLPLNRQG